MREYDPCMGCQYYNKPYWSIVSPCDSCPRIYDTDSFVTTVTTQTYTNTNNYFKITLLFYQKFFEFHRNLTYVDNRILH